MVIYKNKKGYQIFPYNCVDLYTYVCMFVNVGKIRNIEEWKIELSSTLVRNCFKSYLSHRELVNVCLHILMNSINIALSS